MVKPTRIDEHNLQAMLLGEVIMRILDRKANHKCKIFQFETKLIIDFKKRMRVSSFDKFETTTYISFINFYLNDKDLEGHKPLGTLVVYIQEEYLADLMSRLDYPLDDEDDPEELEDACGTLCNLIAGNFKSGLTQLGYTELEMSHFFSFRNEILNGVEYNTKLSNKYQISFEVNRKKCLVVDLALASVPREAGDA